MKDKDIEVQVHPLVIINCADHTNRAQYIEPKSDKVCGVLLGRQDGKVVEIINTIEVKASPELKIDADFLQNRI